MHKDLTHTVFLCLIYVCVYSEFALRKAEKMEFHVAYPDEFSQDKNIEEYYKLVWMCVSSNVCFIVLLCCYVSGEMYKILNSIMCNFLVRQWRVSYTLYHQCLRV